MFSSLIAFEFSFPKTAAVIMAVAAIASFDLLGRMQKRREHYIFAVVFGTVLSIGLLKFLQILLSQSLEKNAPMLAMGVLFLIIAWRFLFGPWEAHVKAAVLGTFIFWTAFHILFQEGDDERLAHIIAILIATIPAVIWCTLFLPYHAERLSVVMLMFFSGMVSTVPILFYDALVQRKTELQFFVFRIVPESFSMNVHMYLRSQEWGLTSVQTTVIAVFVSFLFVGLIEEASKYWVLRKNGHAFFSSIDDAMQLAIVVAIGFAFAENVTTTGYFFNFVKEYLLVASKPNWSGFLANIAGRSILTSMVHIVSTGVMGYFLGLAIFAGPCLQEAHQKGKRYIIVEYIHDLLRLKRKSIFRTQMLITGIVLASLLHAFSNFLVTLPDVLPGNPRTLGDLLGSSDGSPLHYVALLLIPAFLYVVGGFWLLTTLFARKENMKERGHLIAVDTFVAKEGDV